MNRQCIERVDYKKVLYLTAQEKIYNDDPAQDEIIKKELKAYASSYKKDKKFICVYKPSKDLSPWGRVYPSVNYGKGGFTTGLCMFSREVRAYLADENYIDIDMKRAHWYILRHLLQVNELNFSLVDDILYNYDSIANWLIPNNMEEAKKKLFSALYSSPTYMSSDVADLMQECKEFADLHKCIYGNFLSLMKDQFKDLYLLVEKQKENKALDKKKNIAGSFISHVLQHHERLCIEEIIKILEQNGVEVGAIIHDGILVSKKSLEGKSLQTLFDAVKVKMASKFAGLEANLVHKPFVKVRDDWPAVVEEEGSHSSFGRLCEVLLNHIVANDIQIDEYSIYQKSSVHPMVYVKTWETYRDYIVDVFYGNRVYLDGSSSFEQLISVLEKRKFKEIKLLRPDLDWFAFKNGAFNLKTAAFVQMTDIEKNTNVIARHYLDMDFNPADFETPLLDSILKYQIDDADAIQWVYIFIARLFFSPDNDAFQVMPYFYGLNNTGKSTIAQIVKALFPEGSIASLNSNQEQTFGLDNFMDKQAMITSDAPQDLKATLVVDLWKSMVSGEMVNVARKNQKAKMVKWSVPQMMASNYLPNWNNTSGAVSKRLALFNFGREVMEKSSELPIKIIKTELGAILNKCIKLYNEVKHVPKTFVDIAPEYFRQTMGGYCESVDSLFQFLNQTDSVDKLGTVYQIDFDEKNEEFYELLSTVEYKYQIYVKHMRVKDTWIKGDYSAFGKFNCAVEKMSICKACSKRARINCCPKYDSKQRKILYVVKGLKFITSGEGEVEEGSAKTMS